jgi:hypothetical protein
LAAVCRESLKSAAADFKLSPPTPFLPKPLDHEPSTGHDSDSPSDLRSYCLLITISFFVLGPMDNNLLKLHS